MNDSLVVTRADPPASTKGFAGVALAFKRALVSQCHPKMLVAILMPLLIAILGAIILLWVFWTPLTHWLNAELSDWGVLNHIDQWMLAIGLFSIKLYLIPMLAVGILLPISGILGLVIAAIFVMPIVLRHLEKRDYQGLKRQGQFSAAVSVWNAVWVGLLFAAGWLLTMPLWLIPPLALVLPVLWWAFAFSRMLRVDSLIDHASGQERRILWRRHNREYWLIGLCLSLINLFPPAWIVLPVFSALVFAHYSLEALRQLRGESIIDA
ncbi:EI24 domain-containing protein [Paralcaligenes sp. KSB-10]|uniref:EI24 domain-containing protein n=1 Tax=Paralcaligenes sp. KSB-10 TaxID=2901142 RepID=UPI001E4B1ACD|nr:EI24 domain-containing protein [Paralcaligenes sp. KSB-10]UHL62498.1 EI24 domain-containing protein [Paralcaligenes sp. KSB-10]